MKTLRLEKLFLLSHRMGAAREIPLNEEVMILTGGNKVGKSSVIKSIFDTLGAPPARLNNKWKKLNVQSVLVANVNGKPATFARIGDRRAIYEEHAPVVVADRITGELSPAFAELVGFDLTLLSREKKTEIPPPAFALLPFYIDQDKGWQELWSSFSGLGQYADWRGDTLEYHLGIRTREYYRQKAKLDAVLINKAGFEAELSAFEAALRSVRRDVTRFPIDSDMSKFSRAIKDLLRELSCVRDDRTRRAQKVAQMAGDLAILESQAAIAVRAMDELVKDHEFASNLLDADVYCPTCGTRHDNSFRNKFSIIDDAEACRATLSEISERRIDLERSLREEREALTRSDFRIAKISALLEEKRGRIRLNELIEAKSDNKMIESFSKNIGLRRKQIEESKADEKSIRSRLQDFTDPDTKKGIEKFFRDKLLSFYQELDLDPGEIGKSFSISRQSGYTGSDSPRHVLAFRTAFLHTLVKYSDGPRGPFVIDTPFQQDQDFRNKRRIVDFIFRNKPSGIQLVLATGEYPYSPEQGRIVNLTSKESVLSVSEYKRIVAETRYFLDPLL